LQSALVRPLLEREIYKHCVRPGQAECGGNAACRAPENFKLVFEIETTGETAILNHC
jgi:hypothetical protein